jgi:hypothetical protein
MVHTSNFNLDLFLIKIPLKIRQKNYSVTGSFKENPEKVSE